MWYNYKKRREGAVFTDSALMKKVSDFVEENRKSIISELFELCAVPSVEGTPEKGKAVGRYPDEAIRKACEIASRYGIAADYREDRGYALCSLGEGEKTVAIIGHADIVPPGDGWTVTSPFEPVEKDGYLFGRGVMDNKEAIIAGIYVQRAVKELKLPIRSKLLTVVGGNEETTMQDIKNFAVDCKMPDLSIVADSSFPGCRCEKDLSDVALLCRRPFEELKELAGGTVRNAVAGKAFARFDDKEGLRDALSRLCEREPRLTLSEEKGELTLRAEGTTAHAASPADSVNAVALLTAALSECEALPENDRSILSAAAKATSDHYGAGVYINAEDEETGKLTCVCGLASTEGKKLKLRFDIRVCRASNQEKMESGFSRFCKEHGFDMTVIRYSSGYFLPLDDPRLSALLDAYKEVTGNFDAKPFVMGGGTYARYLKNAIPFGPGMRNKPKWLPAGHGGSHQPDEAIGADDLMKAIKIYILAVLHADEVLNK